MGPVVGRCCAPDGMTDLKGPQVPISRMGQKIHSVWHRSGLEVCSTRVTQAHARIMTASRYSANCALLTIWVIAVLLEPVPLLDKTHTLETGCSCRDDVLPCRVYLRHCVLAAQKLGPSAHESFLDHTYLADRQTTIRQHLKADPSIMTEEPPESIANRYSG